MADKCVVVFEDDNSNYDKLEKSLNDAGIANFARVVRYDASKPLATMKPQALNEALSSVLGAPCVALVALDYDLTKYEQPITREFVKGFCDDRDLPLFMYESALSSHGKTTQLQRWQERRIAISNALPHDQIALRIVSVLRGFLSIEAFVSNAAHDADISKLLMMPVSARALVDQYSWGSGDALRATRSSNPKRALATSLGYWIWNRLLQFPGALLNERAAASYLDILPETISEQKVREFLAKAEYRGPFSSPSEPYWWTAELDEVRASQGKHGDEGLVSGFDALARAGLGPQRAHCIEGHEGAGFVCIVNGEPICGEHSVRPSSWLPLGAELSRIRRSTYETLAGWIEL